MNARLEACARGSEVVLLDTPSPPLLLLLIVDVDVAVAVAVVFVFGELYSFAKGAAVDPNVVAVDPFVTLTS